MAQIAKKSFNKYFKKVSSNSHGFNFVKNLLTEINKFDEVHENDSKLVNGNIFFGFSENQIFYYAFKNKIQKRPKSTISSII